LLLRQPVGVHTGEPADQRRLPVIDVAGGADHGEARGGGGGRRLCHGARIVRVAAAVGISPPMKKRHAAGPAPGAKPARHAGAPPAGRPPAHARPAGAPPAPGPPAPALRAAIPLEPAVPLHRDRWAWASVLAVLPLVIHAWGAPLGEAVAEDFDFLHRVFFSRTHTLLDGGGSSAFWRPLAHQLYYETLGPLILSHPGLVATLHVVLLALASL